MKIFHKINVYDFIFFLGTFICLSPLIQSSLLLPFIGAVVLIFFWHSGVMLIRLSVLLWFVVFFTILHALFSSEPVHSQSLILSFITYGSFYFFFAVPKFKLKNENFEERFESIAKPIAYVLIIESIVGVIQILSSIVIYGGSFDGSYGDYVQGTINFFSFFNRAIGFNNQVFTLNVIFFMTFLYPYLFIKKKVKVVKVAMVLAGIAILVSSVLHLIIALVISVLFFIFVCEFGRFKSLFKFGALMSLAVLFIVYTQPRNFTLFTEYGKSLFLKSSPKLVYAVNTFDALLPIDGDYNKLLFGLGPGQFSSRAALIASNEYLESDLSTIFEPYKSESYLKYFEPTWDMYRDNKEKYGNSTMTRPFFSILSFISEYGLLLFLVIIFFFLKYASNLKSKYKKEPNDFKKSLIGVSFIASLFLFSIGVFENYWELTPGIFPGMMLLKLVSSNI